MSSTAAISKFLLDESKRYPDLSDTYLNLKSLFDNKLYHQLTVQLTNCLSIPGFWSDTKLVKLYTHLISKVSDHLNQLKLVQMCSVIAFQYDENEAIAFLQKIEQRKNNKVDGNVSGIVMAFEDDSVVVCKMAIAEMHLRHSKKEEHLKLALELLEEVESKFLSKLRDFNSPTAAIAFSAFYRVKCEYYKIVGPAEMFYDSAIQYLAYTPLDILDADKKVDLAIEVSISALIGENVYNFGEVLPQPVLKSLAGKDEEWLVSLLKVFDEGDVEGFAKLYQLRENEFKTGRTAVLGSNIERLRQKMGLMCLMRIVFDRVSTQRSIELDDIAKEVRIESDMVEWMLMKAMSKGLIKGKIDGVERVVHVSWLKPRVLTTEQLPKLDEKLGQWRENVEKGLKFISTKSAEIGVTQ